MDTPFVKIDLEILKANITAMAAFAARQGVKLRPHIKAHKIPEIARMQIAAGANGITVAKLGEAEVMFTEGIRDILVAYPIVGREKIQRVRSLLEDGCKLTFIVDSTVGAELLDRLAYPRGVDVFIKVDSGLGRCGLVPGKDLEEFALWVASLNNLNLTGILTHAGHVYGCKDFQEVEATGRREGELMLAAAERLRSRGLLVKEISIGSTPTALSGGSVPGVTEIRPGNYVFNDAAQVALGVASPGQCSLTVQSTVISRPSSGRAIIDAGSKVLALDQGAHGGGNVSGFGLLENEDWQLTRLSEEHGIIEGCNLPEIGSTVSIIPNHACPVLNLANHVYVSDGQVWQVAARGMVR